jgi:hypothetical protein
MAAVPVTIQGILFFSDVGVGGGPMPGGPPLGIWPNPPEGQAPIPSHPIAPGGPPPYPSHPIYNPGGPPGSSPPGFWGGGMGPGVKPQPPGSPGGSPPQIWPNPPEGQAPIPSHPIVLPPDLPPTMPPPDSRPIDWRTAWTPITGWVVIGMPSGPTPTPSE